MQQPPGINVSGYINSEFGLGEAVRSVVRSIEAVGIPYGLNNFDVNPHRKRDTTFDHFSADNPFPINLILINPDGLDGFILQYGSGYFKNRYNIAFWFWELPELPADWLPYMELFDEIWTGSFYSLDAIASATRVPVFRVPLSIHLRPRVIEADFFSSLADKFVFLCVFDFFSTFQRKNPDKVVQAFLAGFQGCDRVALVLKCTNAAANSVKQKLLAEMIAGHENIHLFDHYMHREELVALFERADCYISLHAAEGFGLTIAEAMYLGKPVIATGYSANMDFMDINNSFPVRFSLTTVAETETPYVKGAIWAEPDVAHCAELMQLVYERPDWALKVGERARRDIHSGYSDQAVGQRISKRIERIAAMTDYFRAIERTSRERILLARTQEELSRLRRNTQLVNRLLGRVFGRLWDWSCRWRRNASKRQNSG